MDADRLVRVGDLATLPEIAIRTGMTRQAVTNWRARWSDFPAPIYSMREGARRSPLFLWPEVAAWLDAHGIPRANDDESEDR